MDMGTRVVHCKKESFDVYIGRPSYCGNPFTHLKDLKTQAKYICESRKAEREKSTERTLLKMNSKKLIDVLEM